MSSDVHPSPFSEPSSPGVSMRAGTRAQVMPAASTPIRPVMDEGDEELGPFPSRCTDLELCREPTLDPESCDLLGVPLSQARPLIERICQVVAELVVAGQVVEIQSFGTFKARRFRPAKLPLLRDEGFVEAPYGGPVEFVPNASLLRQLDSATLDSAQIARSELLFNALREDPSLLRGKAPQLIKLCFRVITEVLLEYHSAHLPGLGTLLKRRRPPEFRLDPRTQEMRVKAQLHHVFWYPSPTLLERLPTSSRQAVQPSASELREQRREAQLTPGEPLMPIPGLMPVVLPEAQEKLAAQLELDDSDLAPPSLPSLPTFVSEEDDLLQTPSSEDEGDESHELLVSLRRRERPSVPLEASAMLSAQTAAPSEGRDSEEDDTEDARL
ncbi:MAG: hypothetical protein ACKO6N_14130 [Myxococcota bacterium]